VKLPLLKLAKKQDIKYKFKPKNKTEFTLIMETYVPRSYFVDFLQKTKKLHNKTKNVRFEDLEKKTFQLNQDLTKKVTPAFEKWVGKIERTLRAEHPKFTITHYQADKKNLPIFIEAPANKYLFIVTVKGFYHE